MSDELLPAVEYAFPAGFASNWWRPLVNMGLHVRHFTEDIWVAETCNMSALEEHPTRHGGVVRNGDSVIGAVIVGNAPQCRIVASGDAGNVLHFAMIASGLQHPRYTSPYFDSPPFSQSLRVYIVTSAFRHQWEIMCRARGPCLVANSHPFGMAYPYIDVSCIASTPAARNVVRCITGLCCDWSGSAVRTFLAIHGEACFRRECVFVRDVEECVLTTGGRQVMFS